jgi:hypothetical protein
LGGSAPDDIKGDPRFPQPARGKLATDDDQPHAGTLSAGIGDDGATIEDSIIIDGCADENPIFLAFQTEKQIQNGSTNC